MHMAVIATVGVIMKNETGVNEFDADSICIREFKMHILII